MRDPWQRPLWEAVNKVVVVSGGNSSCTSIGRQKSVVEVNGAVHEAIRSAVSRERQDIVEAIRKRAHELKRSTIAGAAVAEIADMLERGVLG